MDPLLLNWPPFCYFLSPLLAITSCQNTDRPLNGGVPPVSLHMSVPPHVQEPRMTNLREASKVLQRVFLITFPHYCKPGFEISLRITGCVTERVHKSLLHKKQSSEINMERTGARNLQFNLPEVNHTITCLRNVWSDWHEFRLKPRAQMSWF